MPESNGVEARLDHVIALLELVFAENLERARTEIRADPVSASILDHAEEWIGSGQLKSVVASATGSSEKTVQRRIAELIERRLLSEEGTSVSRRVKSSGLV